MKGAARWILALGLGLVAIGFARLRFDAEVLDLLPPKLPAVEGLKWYQQHFTNSRELIVTVQGPDQEACQKTAAAIADRLRGATNLVAEVIWRPPWLEHPELTAELIGYLWFNQPPEAFAALERKLAPEKLDELLSATREELATSLSPTEIARLSYDPFGITRLPEELASMGASFGQGQELFASSDGTFRMIFVKSAVPLEGYRECTLWLQQIKDLAGRVSAGAVRLGYTGRPAFVSEISASMKKDITGSVGGTALIIAILFWLAHRRWKPMLWLLALLGIILAATLGLGGLIFGSVNVVSMGFAAILLGLAVDYAVVHYQEALSHPELTIPQIRGAIAPSILWAAITTISAFLVLNFGGLPGLAQLGSLVAVGVALSAAVMIFAYLPPLFPERMKQSSSASPRKSRARVLPTPFAFALTALVMLASSLLLWDGFPPLDASADALQPRGSQAYATLDAIKKQLNKEREPLWLVAPGVSEEEVAGRLRNAELLLKGAVSNGVLSSFTIPSDLWPRPAYQTRNKQRAATLSARVPAWRAAALEAGFAPEAMGLTEGVASTWQRASAAPGVFWPTNSLCSWILEKMAAREANGHFYAAGFLQPGPNASGLGALEGALVREGVRMSGWERLGTSVLGVVQSNLWKLLAPMLTLVALSLWFAFKRPGEICLSVLVLGLSGLCLLGLMQLFGWKWNVLNLMAVPLILGTGVDYSIFMQLALRRHSKAPELARASVGRALLLCGGTAAAGFGSLGFSSNAGMASLGQVCAVGIGANMLIAVFLLPAWWEALRSGGELPAKPSSLYGAFLWKWGTRIAGFLPAALLHCLAAMGGMLYWACARIRREVVMNNIAPAVPRERLAAAARELFEQFAMKVADLWKYERGCSFDLIEWKGWEAFERAEKRGKGVLLVTPHLGNWELGGAFLASRGRKLLVLTQPEPDEQLTKLRQASRARWGIETLVVGEDAFAFVEIIKRLQAGATVALLIDRPPAPSAVQVELFGKPFRASIAAAELARASGCAILPATIVRERKGYMAHILPEIAYDRADLGNREARIELTRELMHAFEPSIREYIAQWYHFIPIWPAAARPVEEKMHA